MSYEFDNEIWKAKRSGILARIRKKAREGEETIAESKELRDLYEKEPIKPRTGETESYRQFMDGTGNRYIRSD